MSRTLALIRHRFSRRPNVRCRHMEDRELAAKVMRFVREIGIAPEGKVRTVSFDLPRGVVIIGTDDASYVAPGRRLVVQLRGQRGADQAQACRADQVSEGTNRVGCSWLVSRA